MYPRSQDAGGPVEAAGSREILHVINPAVGIYLRSDMSRYIYPTPPHQVVRHIYLPVGVKMVAMATSDVPIYKHIRHRLGWTAICLTSLVHGLG